MSKEKFATCPYCDFRGALVWFEQKYVCQECKDHFIEDDEMSDYWQKETKKK